MVTEDLATIGSDEISILREYHAGEMAVIAEVESPSEDLRNALQILITLPPNAELAAVKRRVAAAVEKLECSSLVIELDKHPYRFLLRVHGMERRIAALEKRIQSFHGAER